MTQAFFYRSGVEFTGTPQFDEKGTPFTVVVERCTRCGGQGGAQQWAATGFTCYRCSGTGKELPANVTLYTAEKLAKLNATAQRRAAKKAAEVAAKQAAIEAERAAARDGFVAEHKELFDKAAGLGDEWLNTLVAKCISEVRISPKQIEVIYNKLAEATRKEASTFVGTVGERRDFTVTLEKFLRFDGRFGASYLHILRDADGQTIKYLGSSILGGVTWDGDGNPVIHKDEVITFKATVKEHTDYKGEKQTVVARPKLPPVRQPEEVTA